MIKGLETNLRKMMATLDVNLVLKAKVSKWMLLTQLINIKCETGEVLDSYFGWIVDINMELVNNDLVLPEVFILMVILNGLLVEYDTVWPVIEAQTKIDLHNTMSQLCNHEVNLNTHSEQNKAANTMQHDKPDHAHSKHGGKGRSPSKQDKGGKHHGHSQKLSKGPKQGPQEGNETTCHYCHKPSHWRNKCPKLNQGNSGNSGSSGNSHKVNATQAQHKSNKDKEIVLSITNR
jgi:hypothetical protein